MRYALISGRAAGLAAVAGVQIGRFVHTTLAVAELSALIASSSGLFRALAFGGAAYLAWLGLQGFRSRGMLGIADAGNLDTHRACRNALVCNVLNPKVILLFLALYPNFIVIGKSDVTAQVLMLSAVLILINVSWQVGPVGLANVARGRLVRSAVQRTVNPITGAILIGFAAAMLWEHLT